MKIDFEIEPSSILKDVKIITPSIFEEPRGSIWTSYLDSTIGSLLPADINFKHDKFSKSKANVLRGIHGDHKSWKLVSCIHGSVKQVVVDMRENSDTYLTWQSFDLTENNKKMVLVPPGMGNAFYVTGDLALYHYKLAYIGEYVDASDQFTIMWDDPRLNINWPTDNPILSERDRRL